MILSFPSGLLGFEAFRFDVCVRGVCGSCFLAQALSPLRWASDGNLCGSIAIMFGRFVPGVRGAFLIWLGRALSHESEGNRELFIHLAYTSLGVV